MKDKDFMSYLEWSRVIDELEQVIRLSRLSICINEAFLKVALKERELFPVPLKPEMPAGVG